MDVKIDVDPTVEVIEKAAKYLKECAKELKLSAKMLRESGDFDYAAAAAYTIANITKNARIDLLVSRPIRAIEKTRTITNEKQNEQQNEQQK